MKISKVLLASVIAAVAFNASAIVTIGLGSAPVVAGVAQVPFTITKPAGDTNVIASTTITFTVPASVAATAPTYTAAATAPWAGASSTCSPPSVAGVVTCGVVSSAASSAPTGTTVMGTVNFTVPAAVVANVTIPVTLVECTDLGGIKPPAGQCVKQDGTITVGGPTANLTPATLTFAGIAPGGTPSANQNSVITAVGGAFAYTTCTLGGTGAANFAFNTLPAAVSVPVATPLNIPVRFAPPAAAVAGATTATVTCAGVTGTTTLNGTVLGANTVVQSPATLAFGTTAAGTPTANQNLVLTAGAANTAAVPVTCTIGGADAALFGFNPAPVFPSNIAAGATLNIPTRFNPPVGTIAGAKTASISCTGATSGSPTALTGTVSVPTVAVTAGTAPGPVSVAAQINGSGTSSLTFNVTGGTGAIACVVSGGAGVGTFTAAPNPLNLVLAPVAPQNVLTVTYAGGTTAGTGTATLTCTPVAPATGGPFVYNLTGTTQAAAVAIPTLSDMGKWLLIAAMLGFGLVMVGRRNA
jgi:hypothetical protein